MAAPYFFLRPFLAADHGWAALDWRPVAPGAVTAADYTTFFADAEAVTLAGMLPLIASASPEWLRSGEFLERFEPRQLIAVLPPEVIEDADLIERCRAYRKRGYRLAIDIADNGTVRRVPVASFEYLRFQASFANQDLQPSELAYCVDAGFGKIAVDVGSHEMFGWLADKHFDLCDSRFLASRNAHLSKQPDLARLKLLKLLHLVREDGDTREIEAIFREEPKLAYNLLRLVNSVAVGARTKISNFSQAIAILGRRQLQRWLQLLIYADNLSDHHRPNPLMQLAAARGRQLELLCAAVTPQPDIPYPCDNAFMTGLFSLLDVLINLPMPEILRELPMHDEVVEALLTPGQGGPLSQLLAAVTRGEAGEHALAQEIFEKLGITSEAHGKAQTDGYLWASHINVDFHD